MKCETLPDDYHIHNGGDAVKGQRRRSPGEHFDKHSWQVKKPAAYLGLDSLGFGPVRLFACLLSGREQACKPSFCTEVGKVLPVGSEFSIIMAYEYFLKTKEEEKKGEKSDN